MCRNTHELAENDCLTSGARECLVYHSCGMPRKSTTACLQRSDFDPGWSKDIVLASEEDDPCIFACDFAAARNFGVSRAGLGGCDGGAAAPHMLGPPSSKLAPAHHGMSYARQRCASQSWV